MKILIEIKGGMVQAVYCTNDAEVEVVDYDIPEADDTSGIGEEMQRIY